MEYKILKTIFESREKFIDFFRDYSLLLSESEYRGKQGKGLKAFIPKQLLQRLPTELAQVKAGNAYKRLLNEIGQTIYSLYQAKETTKKVCNNIMNSIKL